MPRQHELRAPAPPQNNLFSHLVEMENPAAAAHVSSVTLSRRRFGEALFRLAIRVSPSRQSTEQIRFV
jgi:hypothetical protein